MTEIMHTDGLALALRQRTLLDELHLRCEENLILQGTLDILGHPLNLGIDICLQAIELNLYGHDIIVESPIAQRIVISDVAGHAYSVDVVEGRNVIPARSTGVILVNAGEKTAKLMIK